MTWPSQVGSYLVLIYKANASLPGCRLDQFLTNSQITLGVAEQRITGSSPAGPLRTSTYRAGGCNRQCFPNLSNLLARFVPGGHTSETWLLPHLHPPHPHTQGQVQEALWGGAAPAMPVTVRGPEPLLWASGGLAPRNPGP